MSYNPALHTGSVELDLERQIHFSAAKAPVFTVISMLGRRQGEMRLLGNEAQLG